MVGLGETSHPYRCQGSLGGRRGNGKASKADFQLLASELVPLSNTRVQPGIKSCMSPTLWVSMGELFRNPP